MRTVTQWTGEIENGFRDGRLLCDHVCGSVTLFAYLLVSRLRGIFHAGYRSIFSSVVVKHV